MSTIAARFLSKLRHASAGLLIALALLMPWRSADAENVSSPAERRTVSQRIESIREELRRGRASGLPDADQGETGRARPWPQRIGQQWYNWPNWPNWGNWGNWSNWSNWQNWRNW